MKTAFNPVALEGSEEVKQEYLSYLNSKDFVCIAAKAALARNHIQCFVADHIACPKDDRAILNFLYTFVDNYRQSKDLYHSAAIIFKEPGNLDDEQFDMFLWQRLQALSDLDSLNYQHDKRVDPDPASANFSFSLKEESFFIIGLHPESSRLARRFQYPVLVFNPHMQFEELRKMDKYDNMKHSVRKRDIAKSGSINPMLKDFGNASEVYQYSGRQYDNSWQCPLHIKHTPLEHNTAS